MAFLLATMVLVIQLLMRLSTEALQNRAPRGNAPAGKPAANVDEVRAN